MWRQGQGGGRILFQFVSCYLVELLLDIIISVHEVKSNFLRLQTDLHAPGCIVLCMPCAAELACLLVLHCQPPRCSICTSASSFRMGSVEM